MELTKHSIVDIDRRQRTCVRLPATWGFSRTCLGWQIDNLFDLLRVVGR